MYMAYHPHKAGYIPLTMLSLGEFKFNWVNKLRYRGIYFVNNPNRLFDVRKQITKFLWVSPFYFKILRCN